MQKRLSYNSLTHKAPQLKSATKHSVTHVCVSDSDNTRKMLIQLQSTIFRLSTAESRIHLLFAK